MGMVYLYIFFDFTLFATPLSKSGVKGLKGSSILSGQEVKHTAKCTGK